MHAGAGEGWLWGHWVRWGIKLATILGSNLSPQTWRRKKTINWGQQFLFLEPLSRTFSLLFKIWPTAKEKIWNQHKRVGRQGVHKIWGSLVQWKQLILGPTCPTSSSQVWWKLTPTPCDRLLVGWYQRNDAIYISKCGVRVLISTTTANCCDKIRYIFSRHILYNYSVHSAHIL